MGFPKDIKSKDFIAAFVRLQEDYSVTDLKMSDYDINLDEFLILTTDLYANGIVFVKFPQI